MIATLAAAGLVLCFLGLVVFRLQCRRARQQQSTKVLAFFHPRCSAGGGGERVLWKMVEVLGALHRQGIKLSVVIYTIDPPSATYQTDMLQHVKGRFSIDIDKDLPLSFVHLHKSAGYLAPAPRLSLLVESFNTIKLAWQALIRSPQIPHLFIDTTGCAFTFVVARLLFGCDILAYVHYPTISTDMLGLVWERRRAAYNHAADIAGSKIATAVKLVYYVGFAVLYGLVGSLATLVLVNSTWTSNHIRSLWWYAAWRNRIHIVFPPCSVEELQAIDIHGQRQPVIVSIGQFRPEKDHVLQLESLARLLTDHPELRTSVQLVVIGSCRGHDDEARLAALRKLAQRLSIEDVVRFVVNQPYAVIQEWLAMASVGIHTMWNEHFGIGIVEMMAAGLIVIAHDSGGPKSDIVQVEESQRTGFLANNEAEYAEALFRALTMEPSSAMAIRSRAQQSALRFSDQVFADAFQREILQAKLL